MQTDATIWRRSKVLFFTGALTNWAAVGVLAWSPKALVTVGALFVLGTAAMFVAACHKPPGRP